jgi:hypothetical protein
MTTSKHEELLSTYTSELSIDEKENVSRKE